MMQHLCDRCGTAIDMTHVIRATVRIPYVVRIFRKVSFTTTKMSDIELCGECTTELEAFLKPIRRR